MIADNCELNLSTKKIYLPEYPLEEKITLEKELIRKAHEGLKKRFTFLKTLYNWSKSEEIKQKKV